MKLPANWKRTIEAEHRRAVRGMKKHNAEFNQLLLPLNGGTQSPAVFGVFSVPGRTRKAIERLAIASADEKRRTDVANALGALEADFARIEQARTVEEQLVAMNDHDTNIAQWAVALLELSIRLHEIEAKERSGAFDSFYADAITDSLNAPAALRVPKDCDGNLVRMEDAPELVQIKNIIHGVLMKVAADKVSDVLNENAWAGSILTWLTTRYREWLDKHPDHFGEGFAFFTESEMAERFGISRQQAHNVLFGRDGNGGVISYLSKKSVTVNERDGSSFPLCWFTTIDDISQNETYQKAIGAYSGSGKHIQFSTASQFNPYVRKMFRVDCPNEWWKLPSKSRAAALSLALQWSRNDYKDRKRLEDMKRAGHLLDGVISTRRLAERVLDREHLPDELKKAAGASGTKFRGKQFVVDPCEKVLRDMAKCCGPDAVWYTVDGSDERHALGSLGFEDWWDAMIHFNRERFPYDSARVEMAICENVVESVADRVVMKSRRRKKTQAE